MKTHLSLPYSHETELPDGEDAEFRTPEALVERFLREYTGPGERVLDPFAGYGTTLAVAERLDREPYGLEYEPDRVEHVRGRLETPDGIEQGDVLELDADVVPRCDCCFTSPPFMERTDDRNPFRNYAGASDYGSYLEDIGTAFANVDGVLSRGATVVIDVSNMKHDGRVTTLAWDVADRVSEVFDFDGEVVVTWEADDPGPDGAFGYGYDHSYCLVFSKA